MMSLPDDCFPDQVNWQTIVTLVQAVTKPSLLLIWEY